MSMTAASPTRRPLSLTEKIGYGMGAMTESSMQNAMAFVIMPILNIFMGIDPVVIAGMMTVMRIFDAITDPAVGYFSDRTHTRWGRRKPYMLLGALLAATAFVLMWCFPVSGWSKNGYCAYFLAVSLFYYFSTTMYCVPYISYGYELSDDYNERTVLMGYRMFFVNVSSGLLSWMFWLVQRPIFGNQLVGMRWTAVLTGLVFILFSAGPLFLVHRSSFPLQPSPGGPEVQKNTVADFFSVFRNKDFDMILLSLVSGVLGSVSVGGIGGYVLIYYVCSGNVHTGSFYLGLSSTVSTIAGLLSLPLITMLSRRFEKKTTLISLLLLAGGGAIASLAIYNPAYPLLCTLIPVLIVPGTTATWMLLMSMTADICEYDEYLNSKRREGVFAAVFSWTGKIGITLGILSSGFLLKWSGYLQENGAGQTPQAIFNMRCLYAFVSGSGLIVAALVLLCYRLNPEKIDEIKAVLAIRKADSPADAKP